MAKKSLREQIKNILLDYDAIAESDPQQLRSKIPAKEIWRFFIDGNKQEKGRNLQASELFRQPALYIRLFVHNPLLYTIKEYLVIKEKVENEEHAMRSELLYFLASSDWYLSDKERDTFRLIDLLNMDKAWIPFERNEPGFLKALGQAVPYIFEQSHPLIINFIKQLHAIAIGNVLHTEYKDNNGIDEFRNLSFGGYGLGTNYSTDGLYGFLNSIMNNTSDESELYIYQSFGGRQGFKLNAKALTLIEEISREKIDYTDNELKGMFFEFMNGENDSMRKRYFDYACPLVRKLINATNRRQLAEYLQETINETSFVMWFKQMSVQRGDVISILNKQMQTLIDTYEEKIAQADDPLIKLMIIINFIQSCEQLHPFKDGNCRTFCMLLLNHLLMKNGFPPAILDDPNQFDLYGKNELLHSVLNGMQNTITLINTGSLYNVNTDQVLDYLQSKEYLAEIRNYFNEVVHHEELARQEYAARPKMM